jgi:hypothetical protein
VYFDLSVVLALAASATSIVIPDFFELFLFSESARRWSATFADGERNGYVWRRPVFVELVSFDSLDLSVSSQRPAVEGVERRLASDVSWSCWPCWLRGPHLSLVDIDVNHRLAAIGSKRLIGNLGGRRLVEEVGPAAGRLTEALFFTEALPLHDRRTPAGTVLMDINVAMEARASVVLLEAEVVVIATAHIGTASAAANNASTSRASFPHALETSAVPSLSSTRSWWGRRIVKVVQIARRRAIHGYSVVCWLALWMLM